MVLLSTAEKRKGGTPGNRLLSGDQQAVEVGENLNDLRLDFHHLRGLWIEKKFFVDLTR